MKIIYDEFNLIEFLASVLITLILTYVVYRLKPSLKISEAYWSPGKGQIKIKIENTSRIFDAVNIRIEVAAISLNNTTYHLNVDHTDFLILPKNRPGRDNVKIFKVVGISEEAQEYLPQNETLTGLLENRRLRVRIHSYQSFSGLGKAEERIFENISDN